MLLLPWTDDIISLMICPVNGDKSLAVLLKGSLAASLIWGLNIAIQPVQMGIRAMIVDCCPRHQQVLASAYSSSITGVGSILGYASGFLNLPVIFPWLGDTQFKCLCVIASISLSSTVALSCTFIKERGIIFADVAASTGVNPIMVFRQMLRNMKLMNGRMRSVCKVQFFAWIGWFPFLFYITTYIGGLCKFPLVPAWRGSII